MESPPMLTDVTPRHVIIIPRIEPEAGELSNPTRTPAKYLTPETLLECMMVKRVEHSPYKTNGPGLPVSIWELEREGFVRVRLDIPGANSVVVYPDPYENSINFKGVEEEITMHGIAKDGICRTYEGSLYLDHARFPGPVLDFSYEFGNGVLWFKIRCMNPATSGDLGVQLMTHPKTENDQGMKESAQNPLVSRGTDRYSLHGFNDEKSFVMAIDTPGLGEEDHLVIHVLESGTINFLAEEKQPRCYGESLNEHRREYEGVLKVSSEEFDTKNAQFEINHGVFWIQVPRAVKSPTHSVTLFHAAREEYLLN